MRAASGRRHQRRRHRRPAAAPAATYADVGNAQEVTTTSSGGLGESAEVGGPTVNIVPRTGGNNFQGTGFIASVREWMVGSNSARN